MVIRYHTTGKHDHQLTREMVCVRENSNDPEIVEIGRPIRRALNGVRRTRQTVYESEGLTQASGSGRFPVAFCELERDNGIICVGVKRGIFLEQFYYDSESNRCAHFVYNGCGGNANRFSTLWECNLFCGRRRQKK